MVSAYRNKLMKLKGDSFESISKLIYKAYTEDILPAKHTSEYKKLDKLATIDQFMKYLIDKNPSSIPRNEHWEPYWSLCYPCDIDYDYMLKLDSIEEESSYLFDKLNVKDIHYPHGYGKISSSSYLNQIEKNITNRKRLLFHCI